MIPRTKAVKNVQKGQRMQKNFQSHQKISCTSPFIPPVPHWTRQVTPNPKTKRTAKKIDPSNIFFSFSVMVLPPVVKPIAYRYYKRPHIIRDGDIPFPSTVSDYRERSILIGCFMLVFSFLFREVIIEAEKL